MGGGGESVTIVLSRMWSLLRCMHNPVWQPPRCLVNLGGVHGWGLVKGGTVAVLHLHDEEAKLGKGLGGRGHVFVSMG